VLQVHDVPKSRRKEISKLDSMRWFSDRRSPSPPGARNGIVCCCLLRTAYDARVTMHCQWGWLLRISLFVLGDLDLWPLTLTYELGRNFCTMYLTAKFHHPTFKNKQTHWQTNRRRWKHPRFAIRYTPVGNHNLLPSISSAIYTVSQKRVPP